VHRKLADDRESPLTGHAQAVDSAEGATAPETLRQMDRSFEANLRRAVGVTSSWPTEGASGPSGRSGRSVEPDRSNGPWISQVPKRRGRAICNRMGALPIDARRP